MDKVLDAEVVPQDRAQSNQDKLDSALGRLAELEKTLYGTRQGADVPVDVSEGRKEIEAILKRRNLTMTVVPTIVLEPAKPK